MFDQLSAEIVPSLIKGRHNTTRRLRLETRGGRRLLSSWENVCFLRAETRLQLILSRSSLFLLKRRPKNCFANQIKSFRRIMAFNHRNHGANWNDDGTTDDDVTRTTEAMRLLGNLRVKTLSKRDKNDAATSEAESGNESSTSGFVHPRKSRTKKRHMTNSGEKPSSKEARGEGPRDRSEARYSSRYRDGSLLTPSAEQANATRMAAEHRAGRYRDDANTGRRPRPRGSGLGGGDVGYDNRFNRGRSSGRGRGRGGRQFNGHGNGRNGNNFSHINPQNAAAGMAAQLN
jgi:hypothetical protein